MKLRTTLLLLIAAIALGCFIRFFERASESTREREEQARRALRVRTDKVSYLRFESTNLLVECAREDDHWMMIQPVRARADAGGIDRILAGLRDLPRGEVISASEQKRRQLSLAQYGLDRPRARITLGDSLHRQTLLVGREALLGGSVYVKDEARGEIVGTDTNLLALIPAAASDLRDRTLFPGSPQAVQRIEIGGGGRFLQLAKTEKGRWMLQQPLVSRASPIVVQEILDALYAVRVEQFATDSGADLVRYGLDDPGLKVTVWCGEKQGDTTLLFGGPVAGDKDLVYAKLKSGDPVYAVPANILGRLRVGAAEVRDHRLLTMSAYDISYFRAQEGERTVELRKRDDEWEMVDPKPWKADDQRVRDLLTAWAGATIVSFIDDAGTNLAALGLSPPTRVLQFSSKLGPGAAIGQRQPMAGVEEKATVLVSSSPREVGRVLVKLDSEAPLYEILGDVLKTVSLDPLFYRDREVMNLNSDDIVRITRQKDGQEQTAERSEAGDFTAAPGAAGPLNQEAVKDLLMAASHLRISEFVADDPRDLSAFGLDTPSAVLTLGLKGETGISKSLLFGGEAGAGGVYAMLRGQDVVFVLETGVRDQLLGDLYEGPTPAADKPAGLGTNEPTRP
ncbi:MAG: DUF4340 domain-containing protein [Verrucomicrobiota bacterium]